MAGRIESGIQSDSFVLLPKDHKRMVRRIDPNTGVIILSTREIKKPGLKVPQLNEQIKGIQNSPNT